MRRMPDEDWTRGWKGQVSPRVTLILWQLEFGNCLHQETWNYWRRSGVCIALIEICTGLDLGVVPSWFPIAGDSCFAFHKSLIRGEIDVTPGLGEGGLKGMRMRLARHHFPATLLHVNLQWILGPFDIRETLSASFAPQAFVDYNFSIDLLINFDANTFFLCPRIFLYLP